MEWNVANFIALSVVLAVLATTSVALRFWAHTKSGNRSGPDGFLIILALVSNTEIPFQDEEADNIAVGRDWHGRN